MRGKSGQTESLAHIAPFVEVSRQNFIREVREELDFIKDTMSKDEFDEKVRELAEIRVKDEIKRGVQTIQYQILTLNPVVVGVNKQRERRQKRCGDR